MALRLEPMNEISGANVRRFLNLLLVKARHKVCLFSCVGDHRPCLRLHFASLDGGRVGFDSEA